MDEDPSPFDLPAVPDNAGEIAALITAIRLRHGFSLLFVESRSQEARRDAIEAVKAALPDKRIVEVSFLNNHTDHLLDELRTLDLQDAGALFVIGLDTSMTADPPEFSVVVANLNASRDTFPSYVPCPMVLCLPPPAIVAIARGAPDFFSVRSGVYRVAGPEPQPQSILLESIRKEPLFSFDLDPVAQLASIDEQLTDSAGATSPERAALLMFQSDLLADLRRPAEALAAAEEAVVLLRPLARHGDRPKAALAASLGTLSTRLAEVGRPHEALAAGEESARGFRDLAARHFTTFAPDYARGLGNLSNRRGSLAQREESVRAAEEAVAIFRQLSAESPAAFAADLAQALGNVAGRLAAVGRFEDANAASGASVALYRQLAAGDQRPDAPFHLGQALHNHAVVLGITGDRRRALDASREAMRLFRGLPPEVFVGFARARTRARASASAARRELEAGSPELAKAEVAAALGDLMALDGQYPGKFTTAIEEALRLRDELDAAPAPA